MLQGHFGKFMVTSTSSVTGGNRPLRQTHGHFDKLSDRWEQVAESAVAELVEATELFHNPKFLQKSLRLRIVPAESAVEHALILAAPP